MYQTPVLFRVLPLRLALPTLVRLVLCLALTAASMQSPALAQTVKIDESAFGNQLDESDQLSGLGTQFKPSETVYLKVSLNGRPATGILSCQFFLGNQKIVTASADLAALAQKNLPPEMNAYGVFSLKPTSPFPVSNGYRADVYYNELKLGTYRFEILPDKAAAPPMQTPSNQPEPPSKSKGREDIVKTLLSGTAYVDGTDEEGASWSGTAWLLDKERRLLVTNDHVANAGAHSENYGAVKQLQIAFPEYRNGRLIHDKSYYEKVATPIKVKVIYGDYDRDLAIVQAERIPDELAAIPLAEQSPGLGQSLHSLGGVPAGSEGYWIYTTGEVRAVYKRTLANDVAAQVVEADMQTNRGNSGGPVVNDRGELVAVVEGHNTVARSVSLYIDVSEVHAFLKETKDLIEPKTVDALLRRAENHFESGRMNAALKDMTAVLRKDPNHAYAMSSRGWIFYDQGDLDTALTEFSDAIDADRTMAYAYRGRATVHSDRGNYEQAVKDYTYAIKNVTDTEDVSEMYNDRGVAYLDWGDYQAALRDFDRAIDVDDQMAWAHANRGDALSNLDRDKDALGAFQKAIQINSKEPEFLWMMAKSAQALENHTGAIDLLDIAIKLNDQQSDYWVAKAKSLAAMGKMDQAVELLIRAIEIDGDDDRVYNEVGMVGFELENYPLAQTQFRIAAKMEPDDSVYWMNAGHASLKLRHLQDSIREFTRSIELDDSDADAFALRGEALTLVGRDSDAKKDFSRAKEILPGVFEKYSTKYLKIANRSGEPIEVMVRYRAKGTDGKRHWYPPSDQSIVFTFAPGEASTLKYQDRSIHGDQFYIWAKGEQTGTLYSDFKNQPWKAVGTAGYLSAIDEAEVDVFTFVPKGK